MRRSSKGCALLLITLAAGCASRDVASDGAAGDRTTNRPPEASPEIRTPGQDSSFRPTPPQQLKYLAAYEAAGRPVLALIVSREAELPPAAAGEVDRVMTEDTVRESTAVIRDEPPGLAPTTTHPASQPMPAVSRQATHVPEVDHALLESVMLHWLSADGQVPVLRPRAGTPQRQSDAQVVITVHAVSVRQSAEGLRLRLLADAVRGDVSIARATIDLDAPITPERLETYTRYLARKLTDGLADAWTRG